MQRISLRAATLIVGGFSLAGLAQIRTALPVYLSAGVDYAEVGITTSPRPALRQGSLDDLYAASGWDKTQFWLPKVEADQRLGIPANVTDPYAWTRRNSLFGPSLWFYDLSVIKKILVREGVHLGFEANFFNIFNRAILGPPVAVLSDARFGRVTGTLSGSNPRQIQLGLKLAFTPSRPGEFHPEPLTDPDSNLSIHPARAIDEELPPFVKTAGSSCHQLTL